MSKLKILRLSEKVIDLICYYYFKQRILVKSSFSVFTALFQNARQAVDAFYTGPSGTGILNLNTIYDCTKFNFDVYVTKLSMTLL